MLDQSSVLPMNVDRLHVHSDLISYTIAGMDPLRLDESVSSSGLSNIHNSLSSGLTLPLDQVASVDPYTSTRGLENTSVKSWVTMS